jgi:serine/threonine protein kinase/tetratricopeptide (TPR) repeat protein
VTLSADEFNPVAASGLNPGACVGPYELIRLLGAGGMAEVWLARRADGAFKREVALKLPLLTRRRQDLERRFAHERDILASLEHPNIARLYDAGVDTEGLPYLSMEYVQGQTLMTWCDGQSLGISARLALFLQVLEAVKYAHENHVIHRDLKPSNILVTESGHVRLLDFGVAKLLQGEDGWDQTQLSRVYGQALTPDYASPELLSGARIDARSDVYSLGMVLYELLTGARPYRLNSRASIAALKQAAAAAEVKSPSTQVTPEASVGGGENQDRLTRKSPGDLDAIVLKALAKEPAERYESAASMAEDLQRYLHGAPVKARLSPVLYPIGKFLQRNRATVWFAAMSVVAILAAVGADRLMLSKRVESAPPPLLTLPARSVAVLPFTDMSEKHDQEYFSDGLSEELIDMLTQVPGLQVPARTSSFYFKGKSATIPEIANTLHVSHVLEGSVRKAGNTIRVTAQLVRADNGYYLWSETYDRDIKDIFKVQDEIAAAVVVALRGKLALSPKVSSRRTSNAEAYNQLLLGRQFFNRSNADALRRAVAAYHQAIALDPNYAAAYAGLADAEDNLADWTGDTSGFRRAEVAADKAIALAPDEADGYSARGSQRIYHSWDWAGAQSDFIRALRLNPTDSVVLRAYGIMLGSLGRFPEAMTEIRKAIAIDPLSSRGWEALGTFLLAQKNFPATHEALRRALEIQPDDALSLNRLGVLQLLEGKAQDALSTYRLVDDDGFRLYGIAMAEHTLGHAKASQQALDEEIAKHASDSAYQIAEACSWRGEKDSAFSWLERAYRQGDGGLAEAKIDPLLENLRGDPRYEALLRKLNLVE